MMKIKVKTESSFIRGLSLFFLVVGVVTFTVSYIYSESLAAPGAWPTDSQWTLVTSNGSVIADEEEQASCLDSTRNAAVSGSIDLASQADCSGPAPHYNPGNNGQPGATHQNTFTFGNYYEDQNNDSNSCINISDDYVFFRIRLAGDPYQAQAVNGFNNVIYFVLIDADADGDTDFYLRLNGNGDKASETFEILYETTADNDPTGEPVVHSHLNPINNGFARAFATPDNGIVGDSAQYFIDLQVPVTDFDDNLGAQVLCSGVVTLANVMTSQNVNDPDQKDFKLGLGTYSDPIIFDPPEYQVTKTAVDVNGGSLVPGDVVEYTATLTNLAGSLSDIVFTDVLPVGSTFVPNAYGAGSGIQVTLGTNTYNMSNAVDSQDTGGCSTATKCKADLTGSTVNFSNDFLYAKGSVTPLYDDIVIKFQTIYATSGTFVNQSTTTTHELPNIRYSDDPGVDDTIDCTTASVDNCNDGITGNDDTTNVTVISAPELSTSTKTDDDVDNSVLPGQTVTYTTTLINTGNETGTGINIDDTIDANSENLANF
ncbi:MAG: hypothetical protein Q8P90_02470, partial [bacterium]|nr:hypothetical protein [bacterium]